MKRKKTEGESEKAPEPKDFLPNPETLMPYFTEQHIKEVNKNNPNQIWKELTGTQTKIGDLVYVLFEGLPREGDQCFLGKVIYIGEEKVRIHFVDASHQAKTQKDKIPYQDLEIQTTFYLARRQNQEQNQEQDQDQGTTRPCGAKIKEKGFGTHKTGCEVCKNAPLLLRYDEQNKPCRPREDEPPKKTCQICPELKNLGLTVEEMKQQRNELNTKLEQLQTQIKQLASNIQRINTNIERLQTNSNEHKQTKQKELGAWGTPRYPKSTTTHQQPPTRPQANPKTPNPFLEIAIINVPYTKGENTTKIVEKIIQAREIKTNPKFTCFRALSKTKELKEQEKPPKIIVRLNNNEDKNSLLKNTNIRLNTANVGYDFPKKDKDIHIYINENTTEQQSNIYRLARQLKKDLNFKYVWTRNGITKIREDDETPIYTIETKEELERIRRQRQEQTPNSSNSSSSSSSKTAATAAAAAATATTTVMMTEED